MGQKNPTAAALIGAAAVQIFVGILGWYFYRERFGWLDWLINLSGLIYLGLGLAAYWAPRIAALLAIVLYAAYLGFQLSRSLELFWSGWIIKGPILILLFIALVFAMWPKTKP